MGLSPSPTFPSSQTCVNVCCSACMPVSQTRRTLKFLSLRTAQHDERWQLPAASREWSRWSTAAQGVKLGRSRLQSFARSSLSALRCLGITWTAFLASMEKRNSSAPEVGAHTALSQRLSMPVNGWSTSTAMSCPTLRLMARPLTFTSTRVYSLRSLQPSCWTQLTLGRVLRVALLPCAELMEQKLRYPSTPTHLLSCLETVSMHS
mmetsp:Transcript_264/g.714  ORF Transcript_264/g.714 Transcript_264/m.714 type:complete len:206 (+) Transcript_264:185-802(+)